MSESIVIKHSDKLRMDSNGDITILDPEGKIKHILSLQPRHPENIIDRAIKAGERAEFEALAKAIHQLAEKRDELEAQLREKEDESEKQYEALRKLNVSLAEAEKSNATLTANFQTALQNAQEAERRLGAIEEILLELEGSLTQKKKLPGLNHNNLLKELRRIHATLIPLRQNIINGTI